HQIDTKDPDHLPHWRRVHVIGPIAVIAANALRIHDVFGDHLGEALAEAVTVPPLEGPDAWRRARRRCRRMRIREQVHRFVQRVFEARFLPEAGRGHHVDRARPTVDRPADHAAAASAPKEMLQVPGHLAADARDDSKEVPRNRRRTIRLRLCEVGPPPLLSGENREEMMAVAVFDGLSALVDGWPVTRRRPRQTPTLTESGIARHEHVAGLSCAWGSAPFSQASCK